MGLSTSGIPQGSVRGPILFAIYINDLPDLVVSDIIMYAEDKKMSKELRSNEDLETVQTDLFRLQDWSDKW